MRRLPVKWVVPRVAVTPFQRRSVGEIVAVAVTIWTGSARYEGWKSALCRAREPLTAESAAIWSAVARELERGFARGSSQSPCRVRL